MTTQINVIDLFAGPGGLGEGFSSFTFQRRKPFQIKLSVEKDDSAHRTLTLRAFARKFGRKLPSAYYEYLQDAGLTSDFLRRSHPYEWDEASSETLSEPQELGVDDEKIFTRLRQIKKSESGPFVVIGGPPCQAYSVMGRIKNRSVEGYVAEKDTRHFLYKEYLKVLDAVKPEAFVMENVRGILTAKIKDQKIFPLILDDLACPAKAIGKRTGEKYLIYSLSTEPYDFEDGIRPVYRSGQDFVIKSEEYGIPQNRHRVILLGVREDIASSKTPTTLEPAQAVNTDDILDGLPNLRSALSRGKDDENLWHSTVVSEALKLVSILQKSDPVLAEHVARIASTIRIPKRQLGNKRFLPCNHAVFRKAPAPLREFMEDPQLKGCLNHFAKSHMAADLQRYMFCAAFAEMNKDRAIPSPCKKDFPKELAPNHKSWETGKFADRFRVQFRGRASSTVTSHMNRDGHYFIHYDPRQCRSLTVREAARLQTFPDNYFFEGNQTQQYVQVGNAVPPFLAAKIADIVFGLFR